MTPTLSLSLYRKYEALSTFYRDFLLATTMGLAAVVIIQVFSTSIELGSLLLHALLPFALGVLTEARRRKWNREKQKQLIKDIAVHIL